MTLLHLVVLYLYNGVDVNHVDAGHREWVLDIVVEIYEAHFSIHIKAAAAISSVAGVYRCAY